MWKSLRQTWGNIRHRIKRLVLCIDYLNAPSFLRKSNDQQLPIPLPRSTPPPAKFLPIELRTYLGIPGTDSVWSSPRTTALQTASAMTVPNSTFSTGDPRLEMVGSLICSLNENQGGRYWQIISLSTVRNCTDHPGCHHRNDCFTFCVASQLHKATVSVGSVSERVRLEGELISLGSNLTPGRQALNRWGLVD
jgi:hypothetical protein